MRDAYTADEAWARAEDARDPLAWCREAFELPRAAEGTPLVYLCGNSLGLLPKAAATRVQAELEAWGRLGVAAHFGAPHPWYSYGTPLCGPLGRLIGAAADEVVAMNSLTVNLHLMLVTFYRPEGTRRKILLEESAFPSDRYALASHLAARGIAGDALLVARPRPGESLLRTEDLEALLGREGREIALVWLGAVHYYTGQLLELERISAAARRAGCVVGFDLAHAIGNVPLALHDWGVDFAVWCSYKYLNAGPGAVGGCYVHQRHGRNLSLPRFAGWWGNDPTTRFAMQSQAEFQPVSGMAGWQVSNPPILAMAPLAASLELFEQAGLAGLRRKSERLTGYLEFLLDALGGDRLEVITPRRPAERGCQLSVRVRGGGAELSVQRLRERGIVTDYREPDVIRVAPVPMYNTFQEAWRFGRTLAELLAAG